MSYFQEIDPGGSFGPFLLLRQELGFVPHVYRAQTLLPRLIEAETGLAGSLLLKPSPLTRLQKESMLLSIAVARGNAYWITAQARILKVLGLGDEKIDRIATDPLGADLRVDEIALLEFARKLCDRPASVSRPDIEALRRSGFSDMAILEAVQVTALGAFFCTLSTGLGIEPDSEPRVMRQARPGSAEDAPAAAEAAGTSGHNEPGPWLQAVEMTAESFGPFAFFRDRYGFVPGLFRAQTLRPEIIEAEVNLVSTILLSEDVLSRERKELILLAVSAANLDAYAVALHSELLRNLGMDEEVIDQIVVDHRRAGLSEEDRALLDFALKLGPGGGPFSRDDIVGLRRQGFAEAQVLEAVLMVSLTQFLNTLQAGLGPAPDFAVRPACAEKMLKLPRGTATLMGRERASRPRPAGDDDEGLVERVRRGDREAFEGLVRRHHRRIYRTLMSVTLNHADAEDAAQNTFLKAFQHLAEFQGASRFSTWLTRIAINEGVQRVRRRREHESLDSMGADRGEAEEDFRPGDLRDWTDDPEEHYSRAEIRALLEKELMRLPAKYRLPVVLRDLEHLSTEEAAAAMDLGEATFKTRLSRARLMLRDALAPYFVVGDGRISHA